jgi:hypothetical protein
MEANMVPKWLQHGSKMAPKWLPGGLWAALGPDPAARRSPEPSRRGSGTARGVPKNSSWRPWNALGAKSGSISASWRVPGRVPEGVWEVIWGAFWRLGRRERKKSRKVTNKFVFFSFCCMRFLTAPVCVLFASALAGAKAQLKNMLKTLSFYDRICVCAVCARSANILQTERKSNKKLSKCKRKTPCHGSSKKRPTKHRFGSQHVSKNRPRRPPGAPWPPPARDFRAKSSPKALLGSLRGRKKKSWNFQGRPGRNFERDFIENETWLSWNGKRVRSESRKQGERNKSAKIAANTASGDGEEAPRRARTTASGTARASRQRARTRD